MTVLRTPARILVGNQKGGVGKSSIVANVGAAIARRGRKVALFDVDQQGDLTVHDLGVPEEEWDKGRSLAAAMQYGTDLQPYRNIRPNLDVIMGGPSLGLVSTSADRAVDAGIDIAANFRTALARLCTQESYDIILVDSGHGDVTLLLALLQVCSHLLVPTREDEASIDGVRRLAGSYLRAKQRGSPIALLGVVLFEVNPRATTRNKAITDQIRGMLEGSNAKPFTAAIRHAPGPALAERMQHMTAAELVTLSDTGGKSELLGALQDGRSEDIRRLHLSDPIPLANDYQNLTREILVAVHNAPAHAAV
jgi:chromosome partitioning protein